MSTREWGVGYDEGYQKGWNDAMDQKPAEALAQPKQEPVNIVSYNCTCGRTMKFESVHGVVAPQRTWVGLTDEEFDELDKEDLSLRQFVQAIDDRLKEKNT